MKTDSRRCAAVFPLLLLLGSVALLSAVEPISSGSFLAPGRLSAGGRFGDDTQEFVVDGLVPFWKPGNSVFFLNLRGSFAEGSEQELNAGLVARYLFEPHAIILGANTYYDRRWTMDDNEFGQTGAGLELLSRWVDARANYYHPQTDEKVVCAKAVTTTEISGRRLTTTTTQWRRYEEALSGFDAEIGVWLPYLASRMPTAVFAGHYDFSSDYEDDIAGFRLRVESRVHPNLTLDAEWYEDAELNRTDYFVGFRLHLPLDFWNGGRINRASGGGRVPPFASRMGDMVNRDFRVRTIRTGPVQLGSQVAVTDLPEQANAPEPEPLPEPDPLPEPEPNCYLNDEGEVVCD